MPLGLLSLIFLVAVLSLSLAQDCDNIIVNRSASPRGGIIKKFQDHETVGLTQECLKNRVRVEKK